MRRAHPDWWDDANRAESVKTRWTQEELSLLARREAELTMTGCRFINRSLLGFLPGRSLESIKGVRKREDYRTLVTQHVERMRQETEVLTSVVEPSAEEEDASDQLLLEYFRGLSPPEGDEYRSKSLYDICRKVGVEDRVSILERLTAYLIDVFPPPRRLEGSPPLRRIEAMVGSLSRRRRRRVEYGRAQKLWRRSARRCYDLVMGGPAGNQSLPQEVMVPYWETVMTRARDCCPPSAPKEPNISSLWSPVSPDEVRDALPGSNTAPGPDGLSARILRRTPLEVLRMIYNLVLWCRRLPKHLREARTVLIPKNDQPASPADYRPITVASALVRGLHKVLAKRLCRWVTIDERQRAFRTTDGCADNVFLLDLALRYHHSHHRPLFVASVDVAKAFDTVSHRAILQSLEQRGCPPPMLEYIGTVYADALTTIVSGGWQSHAIHPTQGVRQGDPMSPYIFNLVMDRLLKLLPPEVAADIDGVKIGVSAFADDLILMASSAAGLQRLLDCTEGFLASCGMTINVGKSFTISLGTVPRQKKTTVDQGNFVLGGQKLPAMKRTDSWKYLGVPFTPEGRLRSDPSVMLAAGLHKITRAPLKPQQRLFALRVFLLPALYHAAVLGVVRVGVLNRCDRMVRQAVRGWLHLPADTPKAYFHTAIRSGGLGVVSLRWTIPRLRLKRLQRIDLSSIATIAGTGGFLQEEIRRVLRNLSDRGETVDTPEKEARRWANALHESVDGRALKDSKRVRGQHRWVGEGTRFLSGKDFVQSNRLRINALPTRSRTARGQRKDRLCRAGCMVPETLNHVLQQCHRTHDVRIKRHDAVVSYLERGLVQRGYQVTREPEIRTDEGLRKPDIVASKDGKAIVLDAQVVSEQTVLDLAHKRKASYYSENLSLRRAVASSSGTKEVEFFTATLSWRGLWSAKSVRGLLEGGLVKRSDLMVVSSRVLVGGVAAWNKFNRRTSTRFDRTGVG